jgi:hypothetical protein
MSPAIKPQLPLSQVVFIHDYVQLVFQETRFTLYNEVTVVINEGSAAQGQVGFADALVSLLEQKVEIAGSTALYALELSFESGAVVRVLRRDLHNPGPEAFMVHTDDGSIEIEMNE